MSSTRTDDVRWIHKNGEIRWTEDHHILVHEDGNLIAIEGVARDITGWKQAQLALAQSEERYRLLFEHAGMGIGDYTPEGVPIGYNRVAAAHMGGEPEEFVGQMILEIFGQGNGPAYLRRVRDAAKPSVTSIYEDLVDLPNGSKWFLSTYARVEAPNGEIVGVQILSEDITERRRAERSVVEWKNRYDSDSRMNEVTYGGDFDRILGYTEDEMSGGSDRWIDLIHPLDRRAFRDEIARLVETHQPAHLTYRIRKKDGDYIYIEDDGSFFRDAARIRSGGSDSSRA